MKYSLLVLGTVIGIYSFPQSTFAQQIKKLSQVDKVEQAGSLITQPATIDNSWYVYHKGQRSDSISLSQQGCKDGILDYLKDPDAFVKACPEANNKVPPSYEPVGETKIPGLDSGVSVTVTKF